MNKSISCDIFCNIIDNYGDIGLCWRLARQLVLEHGMAARLWVDDLASFSKLCPEVDASLAQQNCRGVEIMHWITPFPEVRPAQLVIEAFACELPQRYVSAMAQQIHKPVWINLEYLSAEDWIEDCHTLPSPHPSLPLVKYFFFPGFTAQTGGLLLERNLFARRDSFQHDALQQHAFWQSIGLQTPATDTLKVSLFAYENNALADLLDAWASGPEAVLCLVPEGRILPQLGKYFGATAPHPGDAYAHGNLQVRVLPFMEQERYDELLWACDINFVRGEDSCVRAQWAGLPFVWHIYPQHDNVHLQKLRAFMALYCSELQPDAADALHDLWKNWNGEQVADQAAVTSAQVWNKFLQHRSMLRQHAGAWAQHLSSNSLALNLLDFFRKIDRMRGLHS